MNSSLTNNDFITLATKTWNPEKKEGLQLGEKCLAIASAIENKNLTLPYRHEVKYIIEKLFISKWDELKGCDDSNSRIETTGKDAFNELIESKSLIKLNHLFEFRSNNFIAFLNSNANINEKILYQAVLYCFEFDQDPVHTATEHYRTEERKPSDAVLRWCMGPSNVPHWWAASGGIGDTFQMRYGLGAEWTWKSVPYVVLRDITYVIRDLLEFLLFAPGRWQAFQNYLQDPSLHNLEELLKSGVTMAFLVVLIDTAMRVLIYNRGEAGEHIQQFIQNPSPQNMKNLLVAYPGLLTAVFMTVSFLVVQGGRFLIYNPQAEAQYKECCRSLNLQNLGALLRHNPGVAGFLAMATGYGVKTIVETAIFNYHAKATYSNFYNQVSWEHTKALITSNPGVVGAVLLVATKAVQEVITGLWRVLVYNDQNKVHHEFWGQYTWSGYGKMIGGHWAGPGVMNAVAGLGILAFRALIFNPSALNNYTTFWNERSVGSIKTLCQSNPGALGAAGCAFASFLETGARLFLWNPTFAAKDFMFGMEEETSTLQAIGISSTDQGRHFGLMLDKWPGLIYGSLLLATKYGLINWRAYPDYMDAIKAVGGASEMQKLVLKSPGCIAFIAFMTLKLVEEIGFHILIDPRQLDAYRAYEENPGYDTAKGLFASGVVGAAFFALGIAVQRAGSSVARGLGA